MASADWERAVEAATGETIEYLRETPLDEQRVRLERKRGKPLTIGSYWPFIGRGNVVHGDLLTHAEAQAAFEEAVRDD